jgi:predicted Fe-Mo cluster-binding NifX family protein
MKIAIPVWEDRISPLFDVARQLLVVEVEDGNKSMRNKVLLENGWPSNRVSQMADLGIEVLICGGISRLLIDRLHTSGIAVISQIKGEPDQVLEGYLRGDIDSPRFAMPGAIAASQSVEK